MSKISIITGKTVIGVFAGQESRVALPAGEYTVKSEKVFVILVDKDGISYLVNLVSYNQGVEAKVIEKGSALKP